MKLVRYEEQRIEQQTEVEINQDMVNFVQNYIHSVFNDDIVVTEQIIVSVWADYTDNHRASIEHFPELNEDAIIDILDGIHEYLCQFGETSTYDVDTDYTSQVIDETGFGGEWTFNDNDYDSGRMSKVLGW